MEIKVCGITNMEDAVMAFAYGADALGFIFYDKSPRYITPETSMRIIHDLPDTVTKVGVFVNHDIYIVRQIFEFCGLDMIQLHGDETPEYCSKFQQSILIKAIAPRKEEDLYPLSNYSVAAFMIDSREADIYGGTGKISNWALAAKARDMQPIILSGGLNVGNILQAIRTVSPHAVDVNSGVELSPGKKDPRKVQALINLVRTAQNKNFTTIFTRRKYATVTTG